MEGSQTSQEAGRERVRTVLEAHRSGNPLARREEGGESLRARRDPRRGGKVRRASAPASTKPGHRGYGWLARSKALKARSSDDVAGGRCVRLESVRRLRSRARTRGSCYRTAPGICDAVRYCAWEPVMSERESLTCDKLGDASFEIERAKTRFCRHSESSEPVSYVFGSQRTNVKRALARRRDGTAGQLDKGSEDRVESYGWMRNEISPRTCRGIKPLRG